MILLLVFLFVCLGFFFNSQPGYMFLTWAYHVDNDEFKNLSNKHTASGLSPRLQLLPEHRDHPELFTPEPPVAGGGGSMILGNIFLLLLVAIFMY